MSKINFNNRAITLNDLAKAIVQTKESLYNEYGEESKKILSVFMDEFIQDIYLNNYTIDDTEDYWDTSTLTFERIKNLFNCDLTDRSKGILRGGLTIDGKRQVYRRPHLKRRNKLAVKKRHSIFGKGKLTIERMKK